MTMIELRNVSRWYGNVVAVNDITMDIGPGVTGLLGPNSAGKSTILHMMAGFLEPSKGTLTVDGAPTWKNPEIYRKLGLVPERDSVYAFLSGKKFVAATAELPRPGPSMPPARPSTSPGCPGAGHHSLLLKAIRRTSKSPPPSSTTRGSSCSTSPFNGIDPAAHAAMIDLFQAGRRGPLSRSCSSSHVLGEVEQLLRHRPGHRFAPQLAASRHEPVRRLMTCTRARAHVKTSDDRRLPA